MDDFFSFDNPKNSANGRWNRLALLPSADPYYSRGMRDASVCSRYTWSNMTLVQKKFNKSWKHPHKPKPQVHTIFKILSPSESLRKYEQYR